MSPYYRIETPRDLDGKIVSQLTKKDKARLYNQGGGVMIDGSGDTTIFNAEEITDRLRNQARGRQDFTLYEVSGAHNPEKKLKELMKQNSKEGMLQKGKITPKGATVGKSSYFVGRGLPPNRK